MFSADIDSVEIGGDKVAKLVFERKCRLRKLAVIDIFFVGLAQHPLQGSALLT